MNKIKSILIGVIMIMGTTAFAQNGTTTGSLNTTTVKTFNHELEDGTKLPYKVTIKEQRFYQSTFEQSDKNMENWNRKNKPALVAKLITIDSEVDNSMDRVLVLRYEKQLADTFEVVPTEKGFAVKVDGHSVQYIMGEGVYFANTADKDFFILDEFEMTL